MAGALWIKLPGFLEKFLYVLVIRFATCVFEETYSTWITLIGRAFSSLRSQIG